MTLFEAVEYLRLLMAHCWQAFNLEVWGMPIWVIYGAVIIFTVSVAFLRFVFMNWAGQTVSNYNRADKPSKSGGE